MINLTPDELVNSGHLTRLSNNSIQKLLHWVHIGMQYMTPIHINFKSTTMVTTYLQNYRCL